MTRVGSKMSGDESVFNRSTDPLLKFQKQSNPKPCISEFVKLQKKKKKKKKKKRKKKMIVRLLVGTRFRQASEGGEDGEKAERKCEEWSRIHDCFSDVKSEK